MTIQSINTGTSPNKGDGDSIRTAFNKVNNNFNYLEGVVLGTIGETNFNIINVNDFINTPEIYSTGSTLKIGRLRRFGINIPTLIVGPDSTVVNNTLTISGGVLRLGQDELTISDNTINLNGINISGTGDYKFIGEQIILPDFATVGFNVPENTNSARINFQLQRDAEPNDILTSSLDIQNGNAYLKLINTLNSDSISISISQADEIDVLRFSGITVSSSGTLTRGVFVENNKLKFYNEETEYTDSSVIVGSGSPEMFSAAYFDSTGAWIKGSENGVNIEDPSGQWIFRDRGIIFPDGSRQITAFTNESIDEIDGGIAITIFPKSKLTSIKSLDSGGAITLYNEQGLNINGGFSDTQFDTLRVNGGEA